MLSKYTRYTFKVQKYTLEVEKYTFKVQRYAFKVHKHTLKVQKYTLKGIKVETCIFKVVENAIWFNCFTCTVWGLCWYHFLAHQLIHHDFLTPDFGFSPRERCLHFEKTCSCFLGSLSALWNNRVAFRYFGKDEEISKASDSYTPED